MAANANEPFSRAMEVQ